MPSRPRIGARSLRPPRFARSQTVGGFIGIDGGSTSTKAVLLDDRGEILCKAYQLSNGNPIQDTIEMFENLRGQVEAQSAKLEVLGVATTGYAKDILKDVLHADVALVETVAHTESALKFYEDPHVIVDVGGQDIKIIILHKRPRERLQTEYAMLRRQRIFPAIYRRRIRLGRRTICGSGLLRPDHAYFRLWLRGLHAVRYREFPAPGLARGGDSGRLGRRAAQECISLCCQHPQPCSAGHAFRSARRNAKQPGCGQGRGGFHPQQLPGSGQKPEIIVHEHLRRVRRHRRGGRVAAAVAQGPADDIHRPGRSAQDRVPHHAQREHALQFLQEQLPAHFHRHPHRRKRRPRVCADSKSHQGSAHAWRAAPDHRHLRKGPGRRCRTT